MKKILAIFFCALLLLAGCGAPQSSSQPSSVLQQESSQASRPVYSVPQTGSGADASSSQSTTFRLTIPEGYTLPRIGMTLEEMGVCTAAEFIAASQEGDFSEYSLVAAQQQNPNRCFVLEGYLYPDTYEFYNDVTPDTIIRTMLANTEKKLAPHLEAIAASGYTIDEILALASVIEKEAKGPGEMRNISSVLHNRMNTGMQLQCDVTINYVEYVIKPFITGDLDRYNEYYNTYKCPALPAGAICNPRIEAVQAALQPAETDYFYFLTDANDKFYYAATFEEHQANRQTAGV